MPDVTRPAACSGEIVRTGAAATRRVPRSVGLSDTGDTSDGATIAERDRRVDEFRGLCIPRRCCLNVHLRALRYGGQLAGRLACQPKLVLEGDQPAVALRAMAGNLGRLC